jgi:hypothetical protein
MLLLALQTLLLDLRQKLTGQLVLMRIRLLTAPNSFHKHLSPLGTPRLHDGDIIAALSTIAARLT